VIIGELVDASDKLTQLARETGQQPFLELECPSAHGGRRAVPVEVCPGNCEPCPPVAGSRRPWSAQTGCTNAVCFPTSAIEPSRTLPATF